jgi:membrane protease YdiL (CAAX protease family)
MATKYFGHRNEETNQVQQYDHPSGPFAALGVFAARHPLTVFLALALGLSYPIMALAILVERGTLPGASLPARLGISLEEAASVTMVLLGLLPATLIAAALEGGRPAVRALGRRIARWRFGLGWWLAAVAALPATTVTLATLMGDTLRAPSAGVLAREVVASTIALLLVNLWEETAWAGYLQTRLERCRTFFVAAILTAPPFAAVHLPLQIINGNTTVSGLTSWLIIFVVFGCIFRSLIGTVLRGSGNSILAAALAHTFFNRSNNADGIAADLLAGPNRPIAALLATLLLTIALSLVLRRRVGRAYRRELDAMTGEPTGAHETILVPE